MKKIVYKVILHLSSEVWEWLEFFIVVNDIRLPIQLLCGGVVDFQEDAFTICRRGSILLFHHVIVSIAVLVYIDFYFMMLANDVQLLIVFWLPLL